MLIPLRDLRDELQMLIMKTIEMEQHCHKCQAGKLKAPLHDMYNRSHTGTWKGRVLEQTSEEGGG